MLEGAEDSKNWKRQGYSNINWAMGKRKKQEGGKQAKGWMDRETDRARDGERERERGRESDRQIDKDTYREIGRQKKTFEKEVNRETGR